MVRGAQVAVLAPLAVALLGALLAVPLFAGGTLLTDDAYTHTLWAQQFVTSFQGGALRPRWLEAANAGCGSPAFEFYPPLSLYSYVPLAALVGDIPRAMQGSAALALILSGLAMYALARALLGHGGAVLAAALYLLAPYHLLDLYVRSAMGELWAFVWLPLVLLGAHRTGADRPWAWVLGAASFGALVATHLPSAILVSLFLPPYLGFLFLIDGDARRLAWRLAAPPAGLALAACSALPMLAQRSEVYLDALGRFDPTAQFLFAGGASFLDLNRLASLAAVAAVLALAVPWLLLVTRRLGGHRGAETIAAGALLALGLIPLMTPWSSAVWERLELLQMVGFPWRWLALVSLVAALGSGLGLEAVRRTAPGGLRVALVLLLVAGIGAQVALSVRVIAAYQGHQPETALRAGVPDDELQAWFRDFNPANPWMRDVGEYRPRWSVQEAGGDRLAIRMPQAFYGGQRAALSGPGGLSIEAWRPQRRVLAVRADEPGSLLLRTFYYPAWHATADGVALAVHPEPRSGLMLVDVPAGSSRVEITYRATAWHRAGAWISLGTLLALVGGPLVDRDAGLLLEGVGGLVVAAIVRGDAVAGIAQRDRDRVPDAARAAGHQCHSCHDCPPLR